MGGKALLFVILGLSTTLIWVTINYGKLSNIAALNSVEYIEYSSAQNAALAGANMAMNEIYRNPTWTTGYNDKPFDGSLIDVNVQILDTTLNIRRINSTATRTINTNSGSGILAISRTVQVTLRPSNFSKFAYYSNSEGANPIYWTTGDSVYGPFHTQDNLRVNGRPVFDGSVTVRGTLVKKNSNDKPQFNSTFETGVNLPINEDAITDLNSDAQTAGFKFPATFSYKENGKTVTKNVETVYLLFDGDNIKYRFRTQDNWIVRTASSISNNGVIFAENANLRVSGRVKGKFTVACSGSNSSGKGDIFIENDLYYNTDPIKYPTSTDILGLVAQNDVVIPTSVSDDIKINASIYCQNGGFGAEDYSNRGVDGTIYLVGGIIQKTRAAVGTIGGGGVSSGFLKNYKYDNRFMFKAPPKYPNTGSYEILSWYE